MSERKALIVAFDNSDKNFFKDHPDRQAHIRLPFAGECAGEFFSLGDHQRERRRIILWRVPSDNPYFNKMREPILKIPFLAFADESIEDRDDILLPILNQIMAEAFQREKQRL